MRDSNPIQLFYILFVIFCLGSKAHPGITQRGFKVFPLEKSLIDNRVSVVVEFWDTEVKKSDLLKYFLQFAIGMRPTFRGVI